MPTNNGQNKTVQECRGTSLSSFETTLLKVTICKSSAFCMLKGSTSSLLSSLEVRFTRASQTVAAKHQYKTPVIIFLAPLYLWIYRPKVQRKKKKRQLQSSKIQQISKLICGDFFFLLPNLTRSRGICYIAKN